LSVVSRPLSVVIAARAATVIPTQAGIQLFCNYRRATDDGQRTASNFGFCLLTPCSSVLSSLIVTIDIFALQMLEGAVECS